MRSRLVVSCLGVSLLLGMAARPARADVNRVDFQRAVLLSTVGACALQIMVANVVNNQTNGSEAVMANGRKIAGIAVVAALGQALVRRSLLIGSPAFVAETGEAVDETISNADCEALTPGTTLEFRGSFGATAGTAMIPAGFGSSKAVLWDAKGQLVDLTVNSIQLLRYVAALILLGNGPLIAAAASSGGGGCAYVPAAAPSGAALVATVGLGFVVARWRRRRR